MKKAIYGIYNRLGKCLYVGCTNSPRVRFSLHRKRFGKHRIYRVFRWADEKDAERIEGQVIMAYKRKGQAKANKKIGEALRLKITRLVKSLEIAPCILVSIYEERQMALDIASVLGKRVSTRRRKNGFAIFAIE